MSTLSLYKVPYKIFGTVLWTQEGKFDCVLVDTDILEDRKSCKLKVSIPVYFPFYIFMTIKA